MLETITAVLVRELLNLLSSKELPNRRIVLIATIIFAAIILNWLLTQPDCLSIQERKVEIAAKLHPICEAGYCEEELFGAFATSILHDTARCDQLAPYGEQEMLGENYIQGEAGNFESILRPAEVRRDLT